MNDGLNQALSWPARGSVLTTRSAAPTRGKPGILETYPTRPVRIIVAQAAGSASDIFARLIGQCLSERLDSLWNGSMPPVAVIAEATRPAWP
jgi:hypothetical protein